MTSPSIGSVSGLTTSLYTGSASGAIGTDSGSDMDKDTFLKLLVAQLKYQDPSNPTDSSVFMAQTAQFTLVEKMDALNTSTTAALAASQLQAATALVGRDVSWNDSSGVTQTGTVTAVTIADSTPTLQVGSQSVALSAISKVAPAS